MAEIYEGPLTRLALCWTLERRDGAGLALTSHDQPVEIGGVRHEPAPGMLPAAISMRRGLDPQAGEIEGAISAAALTDEDLELGRWDGARARLVAADWGDAEAEPLVLIGGEIGTVAIKGGGFSAELIGAAASLDAPACPETSPECRAELGDQACRVDMAGRTIAGQVAAVDGALVTMTAAPGAGFEFGRLRLMGGAACGWISPILSVAGAVVRLRDAPRVAIEAGTRVRLSQGCDKSFATCRTRFANALNFRGEPHLPGNDLLTRYPGA